MKTTKGQHIRFASLHVILNAAQCVRKSTSDKCRASKFYGVKFNMRNYLPQEILNDEFYSKNQPDVYRNMARTGC